MNEEIAAREVLIGDMKLLDYLATKHDKESVTHPLQELLEDVIATELTEKEQELFYLRFGEGLAFREIARRMGYRSHRTFILQTKEIIEKVRNALDGRTNIRDTTGSD